MIIASLTGPTKHLTEPGTIEQLYSSLVSDCWTKDCKTNHANLYISVINYSISILSFHLAAKDSVFLELVAPTTRKTRTPARCKQRVNPAVLWECIQQVKTNAETCHRLANKPFIPVTIHSTYDCTDWDGWYFALKINSMNNEWNKIPKTNHLTRFRIINEIPTLIQKQPAAAQEHLLSSAFKKHDAFKGYDSSKIGAHCGFTCERYSVSWLLLDFVS